MSATLEQAQRDNLEIEDLRRIEKVTSYLDTYDLIHEEMKRLRVERDRYPILSVEAEELRKQIDALREQAYQCLPYGAVNRNRTWDGRRA